MTHPEGLEDDLGAVAPIHDQSIPVGPSRLKPFRHMSILSRIDCGPTIITVQGTPLPSVVMARPDPEPATAIPATAIPHAAANASTVRGFTGKDFHGIAEAPEGDFIIADPT
jgi:hypothetical protein